MDENEVAKVADFGVARKHAETGLMTDETGTYRLMAPERSLTDELSGPPADNPENTNPKLAGGLLQRFWKQNPAKRPSFSEILEILKQTAKEVETDGGVNRLKDKASAGFISAFIGREGANQ